MKTAVLLASEWDLCGNSNSDSNSLAFPMATSTLHGLAKLVRGALLATCRAHILIALCMS